MATVSDTIPELLQAEVDAAVDCYNSAHTGGFAVTGIVDAELTLASEEPRELRLVLCGGDSCRQQSFQVSKATTGFDIALSTSSVVTASESTDLQSELDPPPGALRGWLDSVLAKNEFVLLVFYRGFW